jgi:hypothetical protein
MVDAVALPNPVTPSAVDLSKSPPQSAAALPKDATPTAELSASATPTAELSRGAVGTSETPFQIPPLFFEFGFGKWMQGIGISVRGAEPVKEFDGTGIAMRIGALLKQFLLSDSWNFGATVFMQGAKNSFDGFADLYDIGLGGSAQFSYKLNSRMSLVFAPDLALMAGVLWSTSAIDVGIPGRVYWASTAYPFPQASVGAGAYLHADHNKWSFTAGVHGGGRLFLHKNQVTNLPNGMPSEIEMHLKSPAWDALQIFLGVRY